VAGDVTWRRVGSSRRTLKSKFVRSEVSCPYRRSGENSATRNMYGGSQQKSFPPAYLGIAGCMHMQCICDVGMHMRCYARIGLAYAVAAK